MNPYADFEASLMTSSREREAYHDTLMCSKSFVASSMPSSHVFSHPSKMDSASDSSTACLVELGSVYFGSPGGGDGGGDGGELQLYGFAVKLAPSAATQPLTGVLRIKSSRMSVVEAIDLSTPYPSSTLTHGHLLSAMTFAAVQQSETSSSVGVTRGSATIFPITTVQLPRYSS